MRYRVTLYRFAHSLEFLHTFLPSSVERSSLMSITLINQLRHWKSVIAVSDLLQLIFGTSYLHRSKFLIRIICPTLIDLHLNFVVQLARHCYHSVCRTDLMALDLVSGFFAHQFLCFSFFFLISVIGYMPQTTLTGVSGFRCHRLEQP